jgi:serine/threonine-protein kinase RsbW
MPKLITRTSNWRLSPQGPAPATEVTVTELTIEGFIDAASYLVFEKSLESAWNAGQRFLILDFTDVHYINSTGISALVRYFELYRQRDGFLCLANVAKPVGLSMHLLGVTSFLPFLKDLPAARSYVGDFLDGKLNLLGPALKDGGVEEAAGEGLLGAGDALEGAAAHRVISPRLIPLRRKRIPGMEKVRVLVITPSKNRFTRVLRLRYKSLNGEYHLLHDIRDALQKYETISPDLVVVDERSDPKGEFVNRVKIQKDRSLTSIIKIYSKETNVEADLDFKIWENDYLIEPFEVLELFTLTEAELMRVPKDRKVFQQQVHFEFKTTPENVEKACKLSDHVLRQAISIQEDATALYAAVKEGIDNAVFHGNCSERTKTIDINFLVDQKKVTVIVEDQGNGFDYEYYLSRLDDQEAFEKARRRILEERARGGLGILLMYKCADRLEYSGAGNILRLEKNI